MGQIQTEASDDALREALGCLAAHCHAKWGDRSTLDVFNCLIAKHKAVRPPGWTPNTHLDIESYQIRASKTKRTTSDLVPLTQHTGSHALGTSLPVIIAVYKERELLLDGNHRINWWREEGENEEHPVILLEVLVPGEFQELPAVR